MSKDGYQWWYKRFVQMGNYFDAFRIDHILGFFRIWSIPIESTQGIMGHFVPSIPVHINEFSRNQLSIDLFRYCRPFITTAVLNELFGERKQLLLSYLIENEQGQFELKEEFNSQSKVDAFFSNDNTEDGLYICQSLKDLLSNVILFEVEGSNGHQFHFRFNMDKTTSFKYLDGFVQTKLKELYIDYFFRKQDDYWKIQAMNKLPALKRSTNMLICGEDLGLVPSCVPDVMQQLGILSLEIQRMPKLLGSEFFNPADAPYLSVVTPSTHDMSTVRGWWEEDREKTRRFFNTVMGQWGEAPHYCEPWINKYIVRQHMHSPAMWCVFQLQDLMGMSDVIRRENPEDERINIPANPKHYWQYRMHLSLEDLMKQSEFTSLLSEMVISSGRN
jgi:4-alpha-glucanotransferase